VPGAAYDPLHRIGWQARGEIPELAIQEPRRTPRASRRSRSSGRRRHRTASSSHQEQVRRLLPRRARRCPCEVPSSRAGGQGGLATFTARTRHVPSRAAEHAHLQVTPSPRVGPAAGPARARTERVQRARSADRPRPVFARRRPGALRDRDGLRCRAGARVVGVCGQCDIRPDAARLPKVGGYLSPSVESVLGVRRIWSSPCRRG
jgi:hypothetical protein